MISRDVSLQNMDFQDEDIQRAVSLYENLNATACYYTAALRMGRGMGSPIPSAQEGAWTREGPKVGGEDYAAFKTVLRSTDLEP